MVNDIVMTLTKTLLKLLAEDLIDEEFTVINVTDTNQSKGVAKYLGLVRFDKGESGYEV